MLASDAPKNVGRWGFIKKAYISAIYLERESNK
jgi:hypothetical protein